MSDGITAEEARTAYDEALRRIEIVASTQSPRLDLCDLPIVRLPETICQLSQLQVLILGNWRESKPKLKTLPIQLFQLVNLQSLHLNGSGLTILPSEVRHLTNLQILDLARNQLNTLPDEIGWLVNLRVLDISHNNLVNVPNSVGRLLNLRELNLKENGLIDLPTEIRLLTNLRLLDFRNNQDLPVPPEIVEQVIKPSSIITYLEKQQKAAQPLNEAKMVLVGQGEVGKTSIVQRLLYDHHNLNETQTKGINIESWALQVNNKQVRLNIWDFGGQEIMHATHLFFITQRTLYLLVIDARQGEQESHLEYWLALIQSFAGTAPVLVIINKCDEHHLDLNRRGLQQKYSIIHKFIRVSARTGQGIDDLKKAISETLAAMPHIDTPFPQSWIRVKQNLLDMQSTHDYVPYTEYQKICRGAKVRKDADQRDLIRFLHDLGIVLNFQDDDRVRDTGILNPEWVTQGVYKLLNHEWLAQAGGVLERSLLPQLLDNERYPLDRQRLILSLMEKFELAFPFEGGERYLIPDLLPVEEPALFWQEEGNLLFEYHYAVLPRSILHRFMVRLHPFIHERVAWRTGVMLAYEGMMALVKADIEDRRIRISLQGIEGVRTFLSMLRFTFDSLHEHITGTKPEGHVPITGHPNKTVSYKHLLRLEARGDAKYLPDGVDEPVDVKALLGSIEDPVYRQHGLLTRQEIYQLLRDGYNKEDEVEELCFLLGIDEAEVGGGNTAAKLRELVVYMERHGRVQDLVTHMQGARPNLFHGRKRP